ncbi:MAG: tetratricopeptide repeat protein [Bryobacteraceae bacterium]
MARITRKELKSDKFALEVGQTVSFFEEHQKEILRYGAVALGVAALVAGWLVYQRHQRAGREEALASAILLQEAPIGTAPNSVGLNFPTQAAKDQATTKAFSSLAAKYAGTTEGEVAQYYLGCIDADEAKMAEAGKLFQEVAQHGNANFASLAKLSLAQIYFADGRDAQGEAILRDLMAHPTALVSKDQATFTLARYLMIKRPAEARQLLDPLKSVGGPVGQLALSLYGQLPPQ